MGPLNSGRSHQAAAGLAPRQPAIQVSSDRAEALADTLDITFDPGRARLPSPAGQRWLDCRFGSSSAETGSLLPGIPARRHSSAFVIGECGGASPTVPGDRSWANPIVRRALSGAIPWSPKRKHPTAPREDERSRRQQATAGRLCPGAAA